MDEQEQERERELRGTVDRILAALRAAGTFEDVAWDEESDCVSVYDPQTAHTMSITVDWL